MANPLTGDFDLVAQFSIPTVNRLLGSIHQKGDVANDGATFLHSFRIDIPLRQTFPVSVDHAGTSTQVNPQAVKGTIEVQVSTPTISLVEGSSSRVTAHFQVMVHYIADDPSSTVPEFIHGELQATFSVIQEAMGNNSSLITMKINADDLEVRFIPAPGNLLSTQVISFITGALKTFLRTQFEPVNAGLPKGLDFLRFKTMPGGTPAVALLVSLTKAVLDKNASDGVTKTLLEGSDDFAIAISSEFVLGLLDDVKQQIEQAIKPLSETFNLNTPLGGIWLATITTGAPSFQAQLANTGKIVIDIKVKGHLKTSRWLFWLKRDYDWSLQIEQNLTLSLISPEPTFMLVADGLPNVKITNLPMYQTEVKNDVQATFWTEEVGTLIQAQNLINNKIRSSLNLDNILKSALKISTHTKYLSLQVKADGLILHGSLGTAARKPVNVEFGLTADNLNYSALDSWVPAGTIRQYVWSWSVPKKVPPYANTQQVVEEHKFMIRIPEDMPHEPSQVCLEVSGTQVPATGNVLDQVYADSTCSIGSAGPSIPVATPLWWDKLAVGVLSLPDPASTDQPGAVSLAAHLDARASRDLQSNQGVPTLVHFTDSQATASLDALARILRLTSEKESALSVFIVLPRGMLERMQHKELAELRSIAANSEVALAFTEDYEGTWAQALQAREIPSTYLLDPTGQLVWNQSGNMDIAKLEPVLDKQLKRGVRLLWQPLRVFPRAGALAPDFLFDFEAGQTLALRRLQGRRVLLNFWTTWSSPCLEQLRYLQQLQERSAQSGTIILAINDGENPRKAEEFFRKNGLTIHFVPDERRQIAQSYRIRCWPTTVSIDEFGKVTSTQFGLARDRSHYQSMDPAIIRGVSPDLVNNQA